jgi:hypothetical protein
MSRSPDFDAKVALFLPLYLRGAREKLVQRAATEGGAAARAWPSLRQANWLGEVAARAASVQDILKHLKAQGERWADKDTSPRFHDTISRQIADSLRREVITAMGTTASKVALLLHEEPPQIYQPDDAWIEREHLALARLYIGALVAWRRIAAVQEGEK